MTQHLSADQQSLVDRYVEIDRTEGPNPGSVIEMHDLRIEMTDEAREALTEALKDA